MAEQLEQLVEAALVDFRGKSLLSTKDLLTNIAGAAFAAGERSTQPEREALRSALERVLRNFQLLLAQKPVRDATETIAEAVRAIKVQE